MSTLDASILAWPALPLPGQGGFGGEQAHARQNAHARGNLAPDPATTGHPR